MGYCEIKSAVVLTATYCAVSLNITIELVILAKKFSIILVLILRNSSITATGSCSRFGGFRISYYYYFFSKYSIKFQLG